MFGSVVLALHIAMGTIALLSGLCALLSKKGAFLHRKSGKIFFFSMLLMALTAAIIAFYKQRPDSVISGLLTFYLVITAWAVITKPPNETGLIEIAALILVMMICAGAIAVGCEAAHRQPAQIGGFPPEFFYFQASLAGLFAVLDISVLIRGGVSGRQRIARHLWRMCLALFIAAASLAGQPRIIPAALKDPILLSTPLILILATMVFWLLRLRFTNWLGTSHPQSENKPSGNG